MVADLGTHIRVKRPDGKVRNYPAGNFSPQPPPRLLRWKLDDPIDDPLCGWVEVSFDLAGSVRWLAFVTPAFLARQLPQSGEPCWVTHGMVVVMEISEATIAGCLQHLLEQGELAANSRSLDTPASEWFAPADE